VGVDAGDGAQVSYVGIAADPDPRTFGDGVATGRDPGVKLLRATANIGVGVATHLECAPLAELREAALLRLRGAEENGGVFQRAHGASRREVTSFD
jgi:hypothetical protein